MKMIMMIADAARLGPVRKDLADLGSPGYTVMSVLEGGGRTGIHAGDRVHPGSLVSLFIVEADDARASMLFDHLAERRDAAGDKVTRMFLLPVERQA